MIRRVDENDIEAIGKMAETVFRQTYRTILSPEQLDYMMDWMYSPASLLRQMREESTVFFVDEGRGYASYRPDGFTDDGIRRFHLEKLYVMPDCRNTGLGKALFDTVAAAVREESEGGALLELNVNRNNPSLGFYEHLGMRRARQGDFPIGNGFYMNDYIMAMDL